MPRGAAFHAWAMADERPDAEWVISRKEARSLISEVTALMDLADKLEAERDGLLEQIETLTARNQFLSTEQVRADVLQEQLEAHERVVAAARVILKLADEERDELATEVSHYLEPWLDLVEAVAALSNPATEPK